jgi:hypothetical protein
MARCLGSSHMEGSVVTLSLRLSRSNLGHIPCYLPSLNLVTILVQPDANMAQHECDLWPVL